MRQRPDGTGVYVIAAAVLDPGDADRLRPAVKDLVRRRYQFHWREESAAGRRKAVDVVAALDAIHLVTVGMGLQNTKQERGRRRCLQRLLFELDKAGVEQVGFGFPFNGRDGEVLLWVPDIVAGAVSMARGDGDDQYLLVIERLATEHCIELG